MIFFHFSIFHQKPFSKFPSSKKGTSGQPLSPFKMRFGPKRASYIRDIGASVSSGISTTGQKPPPPPVDATSTRAESNTLDRDRNALVSFKINWQAGRGDPSTCIGLPPDLCHQHPQQ